MRNEDDDDLREVPAEVQAIMDALAAMSQPLEDGEEPPHAVGERVVDEDGEAGVVVATYRLTKEDAAALFGMDLAEFENEYPAGEVFSADIVKDTPSDDYLRKLFEEDEES